MKKSQRPMAAGAVLAAAAAAVAGVMAFSQAGDRVSQWSLDGAPLSRMGAALTWVLCGGTAIVLAVVAVAMAPKKTVTPTRLWAVAALFLALTLAAAALVIEWANWTGVDDQLPWYFTLLMIFAPISVTSVAAISSLSLAVSSQTEKGVIMSEHQTYWSGGCTSKFAVPTAAVFLVAAVAVGIGLSGVLGWTGSTVCGILLVIAGASVLAMLNIRASVTDAGLRITYFPHLGWPHTRIRTSEIVEVHAGHVEPREHAGWGYRGSLKIYGKAALNLRRGPGLFFNLVGGRSFVVTLDDADAAAVAFDRVLPESARPAPETGIPPKA